MLKKILAFILIFACAFAPQPAAYAAALPISAPSAVLFDPAQNVFLYAKTPNLRRPPASTTKLLTAIVVLDSINPNAVMTVPKYVEKIPPSKIYLRAGEKYYVRDLILALLVNSANDAAEALAFAASGSRWKFAQAMNVKAKALGCRNSHFYNPSGLPGGNQYSTAFDMALIMRAAQRYPLIVWALKTKTAMIRSLRGRKIYLHNHNRMLWRDSREVLGKTGWTQAARHCFVGNMGNNPDRKIVVSMLGSRHLWTDLKMLVDYQLGSRYTKPRVPVKIRGREQNLRIQIALKRAGYNPGPVDGRIGRSTIRAVRKFQRAHRLRMDGIVGPATLRKLERYL